VQSHENLILVSLPAGDHVVELHYGATPVQAVGWGLTGTAVVALGIAFLGYRRLTGVLERFLRLSGEHPPID